LLDVELDNQPRRFLKRAPEFLAGRIAEKLKALREQPFPTGAERLAGSTLWRVRVGDYRILYYVKYAQQVVFISKIDHRKRVYDRAT